MSGILGASDRLWVGVADIPSSPEPESATPGWLEPILRSEFPGQGVSILESKCRPILQKNAVEIFEFAGLATIRAERIGRTDTTQDFKVSTKDAAGSVIADFRLNLARNRPVILLFPSSEGRQRAVIFAIL